MARPGPARTHPQQPGPSKCRLGALLLCEPLVSLQNCRLHTDTHRSASVQKPVACRSAGGDPVDGGHPLCAGGLAWPAQDVAVQAGPRDGGGVSVVDPPLRTTLSNTLYSATDKWTIALDALCTPRARLGTPTTHRTDLTGAGTHIAIAACAAHKPSWERRVCSCCPKLTSRRIT